MSQQRWKKKENYEMSFVGDVHQQTVTDEVEMIPFWQTTNLLSFSSVGVVIENIKDRHQWSTAILEKAR